MLILSNETTVHRLHDRIRRRRKKQFSMEVRKESNRMLFFLLLLLQCRQLLDIHRSLSSIERRWKWKRTSLSSTINTNTISLCEPSRKENQGGPEGNVFVGGISVVVILVWKHTRYEILMRIDRGFECRWSGEWARFYLLRYTRKKKKKKKKKKYGRCCCREQCRVWRK